MCRGTSCGQLIPNCWSCYLKMFATGLSTQLLFLGYKETERGHRGWSEHFAQSLRNYKVQVGQCFI